MSDLPAAPESEGNSSFGVEERKVNWWIVGPAIGAGVVGFLLLVRACGGSGDDNVNSASSLPGTTAAASSGEAPGTNVTTPVEYVDPALAAAVPLDMRACIVSIDFASDRLAIKTYLASKGFLPPDQVDDSKFNEPELDAVEQLQLSIQPTHPDIAVDRRFGNQTCTYVDEAANLFWKQVVA